MFADKNCRGIFFVISNFCKVVLLYALENS